MSPANKSCAKKRSADKNQPEKDKTKQPTCRRWRCRDKPQCRDKDHCRTFRLSRNPNNPPPQPRRRVLGFRSGTHRNANLDKGKSKPKVDTQSAHPQTSTHFKNNLSTEIAAKITQWLSDNVEHLLQNLMRSNQTLYEGELNFRSPQMKKKKVIQLQDLSVQVLSSTRVQHFPCFYNVSFETSRFLRSQIDKLVSFSSSSTSPRKAALFRIGSTPYEIKGFGSIQKTALSEPKAMQVGFGGALVSNPHVGKYMHRIKLRLPNGEKYWDIVLQASAFDKHHSQLSKYVHRELLKAENSKTLKRKWVVDVLRVIAGGFDELSGVSAVLDDQADDIKDKKGHSSYFNIRMEDLNVDFIAIGSISRTLQSRAKLMSVSNNERKKTKLEKSCGVQGCTVNPDATICANNQCHNLWNGRFLFAVPNSGSRRVKGAALDTFTGEVRNADLCLDPKLCPEQGWNCTLSEATADTWKKFVELNNFSLEHFKAKTNPLVVNPVWTQKTGSSILLSPRNLHP